MIYDETNIPPVIWNECERMLLKIKEADDEQTALAAVTYAHGFIRGAELLKALRTSAATGLHKIFDESFSTRVSVLRADGEVA